MIENDDMFLWDQAQYTGLGSASKKAGNVDYGPIAKIQIC